VILTTQNFILHFFFHNQHFIYFGFIFM